MRRDELIQGIKDAFADVWVDDADFDQLLKNWHAPRLQDGRLDLSFHDANPQQQTWETPAERLDRCWKWVLQRAAIHLDSSPIHTIPIVQELRTRRLEASSLVASDGPLVLLDSAVHDISLLHISLVLSSCELPISSVDGLAVPAPALEPRRAARLARANHGYLRAVEKVGLIFGFRLPEPLLTVSFEIVEVIEAFILAHEYGHVVLGHLDSYRGTEKAFFGPLEVEQFHHGWEHELAADIFGSKLLLLEETNAPVPHDHFFIRLCAIRLALFVLDQVANDRYLARPSTHPPADERYQRILDEVLAWAGSASSEMIDMVNLVEWFVSPYLYEFQSFGDFDLRREPPLGMSVSQCDWFFHIPHVSDPEQFIEVFESLEHVFNLPITRAFALLGEEFLESHSLVLDRKSRRRILGRRPLTLLTADYDYQERALSAIGEAWFRMEFIPTQEFRSVMTIRPGVTFSEMLGGLAVICEGKNLPLVGRITWEYYQRRVGSEREPACIGSRQEVLAATIWIRENRLRSPHSSARDE